MRRQDKERFGWLMRQWRQKRAMTEEVLAGLSGVDVDYITAYDAGWLMPPQEVEQKIISALGLTAKKFYEVEKWKRR